MKILYFALTFYPENSGYANAFLNFISALEKEGSVAVDVITPTPLGDRMELNFNNIQIHRVNNFILEYRLLKTLSGLKLNKKDKELNCLRRITCFPLKLIRVGIFWLFYEYYLYKKVIKFLDSKTYDVVFIETFDLSITTYLLSKKIKKTKLFVRVHATSETEYAFYFPGIINNIKKHLIKRASRNITFFISTNRFHLEFIKTHYLEGNIYNILKKSFFVLPNTLNEKAIQNCFLNCSQKSQSSNKLKLFTLGRLDSAGLLQKGFSDLLAAFTLIDKNKLDHIELTIVGQGKDKQKLIDYARRKQFDFIRFIDYMPHDETLRNLAESDIVVLPSRIEGLSLFALETLATKNAVLFANTGGLVDLVEDNGFLFEPQNIEELSSKIKKIISLRRDELEKMKEKSSQIYKKKFSADIVSKQFLKIMDITS